jgi:DNA-binding helix-hairpin-helix protein with protein kinase domain
VARTASPFDLDAAWEAIMAAPRPPARVELPAVAPLAPVAMSSETRTLRAQLRNGRLAVLGALLCLTVAMLGAPGAGWLSPVFLILWLVRVRDPGMRLAIEDRRATLRAAQQEADGAAERWHTLTQETRARFERKLATLSELRGEYLGLPTLYRAKLEHRRAEIEEAQRVQYLERFRIAQASTEGINATLVAKLAAHGIKTAADIGRSEALRIRGLGGAPLASLVAWRRRMEDGFRFDSNDALAIAHLEAVDRWRDSRRTAIEQALASGPSELRFVLRTTAQERRELAQRRQRAAQSVASARADLID